VITLVAVSALCLQFAQAQTPTTTLSIAVPEVMRGAFSEQVIADFEAANPGVRLYLSDTDAQITTSPVSQPDEYFKQVEGYVSAADVVYASSATLYPDATSAGYFLDLAPLTSADSSFNADDFFPTVWNSARWDGGVWLIPAAATVYLLNYDMDAFDRAGLSYPNAAWTFEDFSHAARALTVRDDSGNVVAPGFATGFLGGRAGLLFRSLSGQGFADDTQIPPAPRLATPEIATFLEQYAALEAETGVLSDYEFGQVTMAISPAWWFSEGRRWGVSLLPGGGAGVVASGFAVSAGTQYPELAYKLAVYLSQRPEIVNAFFGDSPARRDMVNPESTQFTPDVQAVIDEALMDGFPITDVRYGEYLDVALTQGGDMLVALQTAEIQANSALQAALAKRGTITVSVAPPPPEIVASPNEITLQYGMAYSVSPLPNFADWTRVMEEFAATDPDVGLVELDDLYAYDTEEYTSRFDCFYMPDTSGVWPGVLDLRPLLDADPTFDEADVMGGVMALLEYENVTYAYPVTIQPRVLWYNVAQFGAAGLPSPEVGWTVQDFGTALAALQDTGVTRPAFSPVFETMPLLMLVASYGGLPLDFSASLPTADFTNPTNVAAVRQVVDLAKAGYVNYTELSDGTAHFPFFQFSFENPNPIYTDTLNIMSFRFSSYRAGRDLSYGLALYPVGEYAPASFNVGAAFISANAQNPDACYRWIKTIAAHPELFQAMPARRSLLDDPAVMATQGDAAFTFYRRFADLLAQPGTTVFPSAAMGYEPENQFPLIWLFRAMDRYYYDGANLEAELAEAQGYVEAFARCFEDDAPVTDSFERRVQKRECAIGIDPSLQTLYEETS
jgi:ABC-type glycerol-3-phosphate transport system substrate-binding protein